MPFLREFVSALRRFDAAIWKKSLASEVLVKTSGSHVTIGGKSVTPIDSALQDYTELYTTFPWVYTTVYAIAMSAARAPLRLYRPRDDGKRIVRKGFVYDLLQKPNPVQDTAFALIEATVIWKELTGVAYWVLVEKPGVDVTKMSTAADAEIWVLPSDSMYPVSDEQKIVKGWVFNKGNVTGVFSADQVFPFRYYNPKQPLSGVGIIKPGVHSLEIDLLALAYHKSFLNKGAVPDVLLRSRDFLSQASKDLTAETWKKSFGGISRQPGVAILDGDWELDAMTIVPRDAQMGDLRQSSRDEILAVSGVPPTLVGLYQAGVNRSVADVQRTSFWEDTMMPKLVLLQQEITQKFIKRIQPTFWVEFDLEQIPALEDARVRRDGRERANIIVGLSTINEVRQRRGEAPVPWGDERWINASVIPGGGGAVRNTGAQPPQPKSFEDISLGDFIG